MSEKITLDAIISRFVPIIGAILFITGLGYLIYTSIWESLDIMIRLGLGFFISFLIVGTGISLTKKLGEFSDVIIGGGILLFYGTLIYGSRTTDLATATIPEVATILTSAIVTIVMAFLAGQRKSLTIIILGILGAYLTPFVIGQKDVWLSNISFNSYLLYFAFINATIFGLARDIDIKKILPLNMAGLFVSTTMIYELIYEKVIPNNFFTSLEFSVLLMAIIVALIVGALAFSSKFFAKNSQESLFSILHLSPIVWFLFQHMLFPTSQITINPGFKILAYIIMAAAYFGAWHYLRSNNTHSTYRHINFYIGGIIAGVFGISNIFGTELNIYGSIFIAFFGLILASANLFEKNEKWERILGAIVLVIFGGIFSVISLYSESHLFSNIERAILVFVGLLPASLLFLADKNNKNTPQKFKNFIRTQSIIAFIIATVIAFAEIGLSNKVDIAFLFFILPVFCVTLYYYLSPQKSEGFVKSGFLTFSLFWLSFGFIPTFIDLIVWMIPHQADDYNFLINGGIFVNISAIKAIFSLFALYFILKIFAKNSEENSEHNFLIATIFYSSLLLFVNFILITICNDLGIVQTTGGIRAILTTFWWIFLAIFLIFMGIKNSHRNTEKLLGFILLVITVFKIAFYDLSAMDMDKKIIVLMVAGGAMLCFSYFFQQKGYLKPQNNSSEK